MKRLLLTRDSTSIAMKTIPVGVGHLIALVTLWAVTTTMIWPIASLRKLKRPQLFLALSNLANPLKACNLLVTHENDSLYFDRDDLAGLCWLA